MDIIKHFMTPRNAVVMAILIVLNLTLAFMVLVNNDEFIYKENSWIENIQVVMLLLSCLIFFISSLRLGGGESRIMCASFSVLCFIFVFREVDVDKFDVPQFIIFLLAEEGRVIFFVAYFALIAMLAKEYHHYWSYKDIYLRSNFFMYLSIAAFLLLVFSHAFDRKWVVVEHQAFYEELSEISAYYMLLVAALFSHSEMELFKEHISQRLHIKQ